MTEKIFIEGLFFNLPRENAPDFVKGSVSMDMKKLIEFAKTHHKGGKLNVDLLVGRSGKPYAALNTWEPKEKEEAKEDFNDGLPF